MHIADGALSTPVMAATNVVAAAGIGMSLRRIDYEQIPRVGVLAAVFFMASFIRVHIGPSSVHLMLNGLLGLILGVAALPALAVALFLQTVLLGFGGVSALGANILGMGIPALATGWLFSARCRTASTQGKAMLWGGAAGMFSVLLTCVLFALVLYMSKPMAYVTTVKALVAVHLPIAAIEAVVAGASVGFFYKVRPDMLLSPVCNRASGRRDESG